VAGRWRAPSAIAGLAHRCVAYGRRHRRLRRALLLALISLPLLAGGWLWLRDSSLVSVDRVQVSGVRGPEAGAIEAALTSAARHMSTLDVRLGVLRAAVAPFRVVRDVSASASIPHSLHIHVTEQLPVAALFVGGQRTAVAADGVVLGPALLSGALPVLRGASEPVDALRLKSPSLLAAVTVLGIAPARLTRFVAHVFTGPKGLTVAMRNGLLVYFGDATRPHAKWIALVRVLTDVRAAGASYVDVRVPERPAAGFVPDAGPPGTTYAATGASISEQPGTQEPTVSALAAGLAAAASASSSAGPTPGGEAASSASAPAEAATRPSAQATPTARGETASSAPAETTVGNAAEAPSPTTAPGG
jgi:cell division protein FtsQ